MISQRRKHAVERLQSQVPLVAQPTGCQQGRGHTRVPGRRQCAKEKAPFHYSGVDSTMMESVFLSAHGLSLPTWVRALLTRSKPNSPPTGWRIAARVENRRPLLRHQRHGPARASCALDASALGA